MQTVYIFRFSPTEGPGYLETFLNSRGINWQLIKLDCGEAVPKFHAGMAAIAMMGGPMSVNDALVWMDPVLNLIRQAITQDVPVIGHCLGGQLLAKALGAKITANTCKEMGWGEVSVIPPEAARAWFGNVEKVDAFHWHYETFAIPHGATHIMQSHFCTNQAFVFNDKHIGFQCHIEMTEVLVRQWCDESEDELIEMPALRSVQPKFDILHRLDAQVAKLNIVASNIYQRWLLHAKL